MKFPDNGNQSEALEVASQAGHVLLENGAEISRVEDTMERIATHYGTEGSNFFVLSNGIFTTGSNKGEGRFANVEYIPLRGAQMDKIVVNIICAALASLLCIAFHCVGFGTSLGNMIIGAVIPLIPGAGVFWTTYYVTSGMYHAALRSGATAVTVTLAIVLAVVIIAGFQKIRKAR